MTRPLITASAAWAVAILAAIAGVVLPSDYVRLSLALFAAAVGLALLVGFLLVVDGVRQRRARLHDTQRAPSPLGRLEYLPSVTTGTQLLRWRGAQYRVTRRRLGLSPPTPGVRDDQQPTTAAGALTVSGYPRPASSTTPPPIDEVEASPRAS